MNYKYITAFVIGIILNLSTSAHATIIDIKTIDQIQDSDLDPYDKIEREQSINSTSKGIFTVIKVKQVRKKCRDFFSTKRDILHCYNLSELQSATKWKNWSKVVFLAIPKNKSKQNEDYSGNPLDYTWSFQPDWIKSITKNYHEDLSLANRSLAECRSETHVGIISCYPGVGNVTWCEKRYEKLEPHNCEREQEQIANYKNEYSLIMSYIKNKDTLNWINEDGSIKNLNSYLISPNWRDPVSKPETQKKEGDK